MAKSDEHLAQTAGSSVLRTHRSPCGRSAYGPPHLGPRVATAFALILFAGSYSLLSQEQEPVSELLILKVKAYQQQSRAHASEGRELQEAIARFKAEEQQLAKQQAELIAALRTERKAEPEATCRLDTLTCDATPKPKSDTKDGQP